MHQWNSEKKQRTFQNGQWATVSGSLDIFILLTYCLKLSSIDRLGTGNLICLALSLARRESPAQSLNVASRSP